MNDTSFWDVIWWMFWFMLLVLWIGLFFRIMIDIFRDRELNGGWKAVWIAVLIIFPWVGVLVYLIARGNGMAERSMQDARQQEAAFRSYVQEAAGTSGGGASVADELKKLGELREAGTITPADYESAKAKILA
jgi:hypothetical protein